MSSPFVLVGAYVFFLVLPSLLSFSTSFPSLTCFRRQFYARRDHSSYPPFCLLYILYSFRLPPWICVTLLHFSHIRSNWSYPSFSSTTLHINLLKPELNSICYLLALLGAHHFLHVNRIRVKLLTLRLLMSYIYGAPILDVSRSHTTTQHSR